VGKISFFQTMVLLIILTLVLGMVSQAVSALTVTNVKTWIWGDYTLIDSVAKGDVDGDGKTEIVTGGTYPGGAQLCVWDSATLALENVKTWNWTNWISRTEIESVVVADVDGDGKNEIVTGGQYYDGSHSVAQLCVWNGDTLTLENVLAWLWNPGTFICSVTVGDVDGDCMNEIVTGGYYLGNETYGFHHTRAQLCVWDGATLALEEVKTWYWSSNTFIRSVAVGDVDGDGKNEIVTGGTYWSACEMAQLCVWDGATLALENVKTWYWSNNTDIYSVVIGDVDGDGKNEIVTGGYYFDWNIVPELNVAQLCVWDGSSLALENVKVWHWFDDTVIKSVGIGDVDGDGETEVVTGGYYNDGVRDVAQLCVWKGATLTLENVKTWYWTSNTYIQSVALADVNNDGKYEIVTGGHYNNGTLYDTQYVAQLCVWSQ
jgi:hypothetical protein